MRTKKNLAGFTILEVMIALTAALFLMLGLARAYKLVGDRVTESQSNLELNSTLRDVVIRLRDELRRSTSDMSPAGTSDGYLVYYEGPFSDSTTTLGDPPPGPPFVPEPIPDYYPTNRFGDIDDYLAFTARAEPGSPFIGFIPRGVLEAHRFAETNRVPPGYSNAAAVQLVPFYADQAEVVYWLSPRWARNANGTLAYDPGSGHPLYQDIDGNQLPDRLDLRRRVLLIRPDLNMSPAEINQANGTTSPSPTPLNWHAPTIPFLVATTTGVQVVEMAGLSGNIQFFDGTTSLVAPGAWLAGANNTAPSWMCGLARMQQVMDLSLSRVTNHWDAAFDPTIPATAGSTYGMPTAQVQANSLSDLSRPENRFAHVRIPEAVVSGGTGSSMPQIALSPPHPYLALRESIFPRQADHNIGARGPGTNPALKYGRFTMVGFLRPEFGLEDVTSDVAAGGTSVVSINRGGSDIVASDVLAFDLQMFDPAAPKYVWLGPDGAAGTAADDDGDGNTGFDVHELGWPNSDDEAFSVTDLRANEILWDTPVPAAFALAGRGDYVDLNYSRGAGTTMRGFINAAGNQPNVTFPLADPQKLSHMASSVSGLEILPPLGFNFPTSWEQSGRFVISRGAGVNTLSSFYQSVFDTWTDDYANDNFDQEGLSFGTASLPFGVLPAAYEEHINGNSFARATNYRQWSNRAGVSAGAVFAGQGAGTAVSTLAGSTTPIRASAPVTENLRSLRVKIRVFDQSAGQIRQQTLIQDFKR